MEKIKNFFLYILILVLYINKSYLYDVNIKNDHDTMENFGVYVNNEINKHVDENEIVFHFDKENYLITSNENNEFNWVQTLIFQSTNGTNIDFQNKANNKLVFHINIDINNKKLIFKNINFKNFGKYNYGLLHFAFNNNNSNNYQIEFENCSFDNIKSSIIYVSFSYYINQFTKPQIKFTNCHFRYNLYNNCFINNNNI